MECWGLKPMAALVVEKDFMTVSGNVGNWNCPYLPNVFLNLSNY